MSKTRLSVNINKIATLRNSRGGEIPNLLKIARDIESFGAEGITVHPRPDERHIRVQDVFDLKPLVKTEFNIEGYPSENFISLVLEVIPDQVTLVPDAPDALTSNKGWDTISHHELLTEITNSLKRNGIRVSIFVDPDPMMVEGAKKCGADRIELYTESYAKIFPKNKEKAINPFVLAAKRAFDLNIGINAGHDLNLDNLRFFKENIPSLLEVSIGHALISDSIYYGLENAINMYKSKLV